MTQLAEQFEKMEKWNQGRKDSEEKGMKQFNKYREMFHKTPVIKSACKCKNSTWNRDAGCFVCDDCNERI